MSKFKVGDVVKRKDGLLIGNEELWNIIKKHKNPKIDFAYLQRLTITRVKETRKDIFNG